MSRARRSAVVEAAAIGVAYTTLYAVWRSSAGGLGIWFGLWQLLPAENLRDDLARSLVDLHSQPPLLNLLFGVALKLSSACGLAPETVLAVLQFLLGFGAAQLLGVLGRRVVPRPVVRGAVLAIVLSNPYFYAVFASDFFYTPYEVFLLLAASVAFHRWHERPGPRRLAAALTPALALVYLRSLFHPLWLTGVVVIILLGAWTAGAGRRAATVGAVATTLALSAIWPMKNLVRFGFFGFSSWTGYHAAQGLGVSDPVFRQLFNRVGPKRLAPAEHEWALGSIPEHLRGRPTLTALSKSDGTPNWNNFLIIDASAALGQRAWELVRARPSRLWEKARLFYGQGVTRYEGRNPYSGHVQPPMTLVPTWVWAYESVVYQPFRDFDPAHPARLGTGFALLFPGMLAVPVIGLWQTRQRRRADAWTVALMMWSVLWVTALALLIDGYEGSRIRYSTHLLLVVCVGWTLGRRPG